MFATTAGYGRYLALPGFSVVDVTGGLFQLGTFTYGDVIVDNNAAAFSSRAI